MIVTRNVIAGEDQHQRPHRLGPLRRHPEAGQVARHQVEQAGHRRRSGEPQDGDGAEVVERAEHLAEVLVREEGEGAAVGRAAAGEVLARDEQRRHQAAAQQQHAHDQRRGQQQAARPANPAGRVGLRLARVALDERHHRDAGLETREAERQLGEQQQRDAAPSSPSSRAGRRARRASAAAAPGARRCSRAPSRSRRRSAPGRRRRSPPRGRSPRGSRAGRCAHRAASSTSVTMTGCSTQCGTSGFSRMCAVASAAESVMVMT